MYLANSLPMSGTSGSTTVPPILQTGMHSFHHHAPTTNMMMSTGLYMNLAGTGSTAAQSPTPLPSQPKWAVTREAAAPAAAMAPSTSRAAVAASKKDLESEDHFDRHLDTLTTTDTFRPDEGVDELDAGQVSNVINGLATKNRRMMAQPSQPISVVVDQQQQQQQLQQSSTNVLPTPLACSRSSSLTSLSSFDAKSVHSSVVSEYSTAVVAAVPKRKKSSSSASSSDKIRNEPGDEETAGEEDEAREKLKNDDKKGTTSSERTAKEESDVNQDENGDEKDPEDEGDDELSYPDSPIANGESSFIRRNRAKHLQQQQLCRQAAAAVMHQQQQPISSVMHSSSIVESVAATKLQSCLQSSQPPLPWQQPYTSAGSSSAGGVDHPLNAMLSRLNLSHQHHQPSTLPATTVSTISKTVNFDHHLDQQQPKFIQSFHQHQLSSTVNPVPAPAPASATMSVSYAFVTQQQQPQAPPLPPPPPPLPSSTNLVFNQATTPRFLMSATHQAAAGQYRFIQPPSQPPPQAASHLILPPPPSPLMNPATSNTSFYAPPPPQPPTNPALSESPTEHRILKSINTSPPESVCSHRSTTSTLSIVKHDNFHFLQQQHRMADQFKPLIDRSNMMRKNRVEIDHQDYGLPAGLMASGPPVLAAATATSSSASSSSGKSQILNPNMPILTQQAQQPLSMPWFQSYHPSSELVQTAPPPQPPQPPPPPPAPPAPPKILNPPVYQMSVNEVSVAPVQVTANNNDDFYDRDIEEFINENFKKSPVSSNQAKLGPNTSLDENDFKPSKKTSFKRASLQSLDSVSSRLTITKKEDVKKAAAAVAAAAAVTKPAPPKPIESTKLPKSTTNVPIVNMTRTAQLRASKQQQLKNSTANANEKLKRPLATNKLNQTNSLEQSTRRASIGKESIRAVKQSPQPQQRLTSAASTVSARAKTITSTASSTKQTSVSSKPATISKSNSKS